MQTGGLVRDPFQVIGVTPGLLPKPSDAHADTTLKVTYTDLVGTVGIYDGLESMFDWSNVASVSEVMRDGAVVEGARSALGANLSATELDALITDATLPSGLRVNIMLDNSPLPASVLTTLQAGGLGLSAAEVQKILDGQ